MVELAGPARPRPAPPALSLTFPRFSARWPRPSRPSQRTVGSGSLRQARSRSRMASSRRSRAVGQLCNSWAGARGQRLAGRCRRPRPPFPPPPGHGLTPMKKAMAVRRSVSSALRRRGSKSAKRPRRWWSAWATMALVGGNGSSPSACPRPRRSLHPTTLRLPPPPAPCLAPGQQQDALQVGVGSCQPPPASSLLHARDHHAAAVPSEQGLQGLHGAAGGGGREGREGGWAEGGPPPAPPVRPHLAWLCGGPRSEGAQTLWASGERGPWASSCSCVTSARSRCE